MSISLIVATAKNGVIGQAGQLPWRLPADLDYFKKTTTGHPIIMGRKTYESIGRALPGRKNIIITHDHTYKAPNCVVVGSLETALEQTDPSEEVFVIGGESVFYEALDKASKIYLTNIAADVEGDRFFVYNPEQWQSVSNLKHTKDKDNPYDYEFVVLERKPGT